MEEDKTTAQGYIEKFPLAGHIHLTFIKITPTMNLIHRRISIKDLSQYYKQTYDDLSNCGIDLKLDPRNFKISDYYKFICALFPKFEVHDCQTEGTLGKPDFFLINRETEFYLELKNGYDGLRSSQVEWMSRNKDKEVWVLFIGGLRIDEPPKYYYGA